MGPRHECDRLLGATQPAAPACRIALTEAAVNVQTHWDTIYRTKTADEVSWYQEHPVRSLDFIRRTGVPVTGRIIDVGGGASTLVDDLLAAGYTDITVADISPVALDVARQRLGVLADRVTWLVADITRASLPADSHDIWHDRAVFHFLTDAADRARYVAQVRRAVKSGGHVIVATFATDGPDRCSGLPVVKYGPDSLHAEFGNDFQLTERIRESHITPAGGEQRFVYCYCRAA
jgi:SAM-dependent methyltransferase